MPIRFPQLRNWMTRDLLARPGVKFSHFSNYQGNRLHMLSASRKSIGRKRMTTDQIRQTLLNLEYRPLGLLLLRQKLFYTGHNYFSQRRPVLDISVCPHRRNMYKIKQSVYNSLSYHSGKSPADCRVFYRWMNWKQGDIIVATGVQKHHHVQNTIPLMVTMATQTQLKVFEHWLATCLRAGGACRDVCNTLACSATNQWALLNRYYIRGEMTFKLLPIYIFWY